ncbi:MAG: hypothetical protein KAT68_18935 [Bacteroidales bacterium]|nr:hypothetical protein [Bacteroidales bacterium]
MDINVIGVISSTIGVMLTIWAIWYAKQQSKKVSNIRKNEMTSLWAHFDRVRTLLSQIQRITDDEGFIESGNLNNYQQQQLPQIFKGLCDECIRVIELIVQKVPNISIKHIEKWAEMGRLKTDWQKQQFINLIPENNNKN